MTCQRKLRKSAWSKFGKILGMAKVDGCIASEQFLERVSVNEAPTITGEDTLPRWLVCGLGRLLIRVVPPPVSIASARGCASQNHSIDGDGARTTREARRYGSVIDAMSIP